MGRRLSTGKKGLAVTGVQTGLLRVEYATPGNRMQQPYGEKDGKFYLPSMESGKIAGAPATKDRQFAINPNVAATPTGTFEGSYVYVRSGRGVNEPLVDPDHYGAVGKMFWGGHFKSLTVRKTSAGGTLSVTLKEGWQGGLQAGRRHGSGPRRLHGETMKGLPIRPGDPA